MSLFNLQSDYQPCGDQPRAIAEIIQSAQNNVKHQTLLGVTGSGKTFTMAHVIQALGKPALIMAPNKTLAAQLYTEFKSFFPDNAVEYFVSYYDYYQPEAYLPRNDLYIEKDSAINEDIDKLRHAATHSLLTRKDVIIIASVSCIYGLGSPEAYKGMLIDVEKGMNINRSDIINKLVEIQYERSDYDFHRGTFRSRGDVLDVFPSYEEDKAIRMEFFDDEIEQISVVDPIRGHVLERIDRVAIYPGSHYVLPEEKRELAIHSIRQELEQQSALFEKQGKLLEKQRIEQRTRYDLEMIEEIGFCKGIENYSRHFDSRQPGDPPPTLLQYFPKDFLLFIDESHISVPQIGGMYKGDRARKETLVNYGFRLPSALDNRPLKFHEFEEMVNQSIYVSATPSDYELNKSQGVIVEQVIRPTGLIDPLVEIKPVTQQVDDLLEEIRKVVAQKERILVTTLTKRMSENLTKYLSEMGIRTRYLHSDIDTIERFQILRDLRLGEFDVLIGINLLREGLDLPEVSLVAILDGDKEGFLRSERSLIQTFGRAARNVNGRVVVYADTMTGSLERAIKETLRRRKKQKAYNKKHNITPTTIVKAIRDGLPREENADYFDVKGKLESEESIPVRQIPQMLVKLRKEMAQCAKNLEFEKAAHLRDEIKRLREIELTMGGGF
ncbi:MAG: excinuclease ABC subunit UvrB [bacterium]|nr:excinuclease ABC subunit UvrB [bacterium]MBU1916545.1 excinuclease ABC subunit UvrB [bacterium]